MLYTMQCQQVGVDEEMMGTRGYMFTMVLVHDAFELFATKVETFELFCRWVSSTKAKDPLSQRLETVSEHRWLNGGAGGSIID